MAEEDINTTKMLKVAAEKQLNYLSLSNTANRDVKTECVDNVADGDEGKRGIDPHLRASSGNADGSQSLAEPKLEYKTALKENEQSEPEPEPKLGSRVGTPAWLSKALILMSQQQAQALADSEEAPAKYCSSCFVQGCTCKIQVTASTPEQPTTVDWLSGIRTSNSNPENPSLEGPNANRTPDTARGSGLSLSNPRDQIALTLLVDSGFGSRIPVPLDSASNPLSEDHSNDEDGSPLPHSERLDIWQEQRLAAKVLAHPMFPQMLANHVSCLRAATPIEHQETIDEQLSEYDQKVKMYADFAPKDGESNDDKEELNEFMKSYTGHLAILKDQLQEHVQVHTKEALMSCWEIEKELFSLTGATLQPGSGATMSDDEEVQEPDGDPDDLDIDLDIEDSNAMFGPLIPSETERCLMEGVRQDLKLKLGEDGFRNKILEVREEILRKRRAGKLPDGTTTVLKNWWRAHFKWPYPTEEEKERLMQETGLEMKQINNWFINQRKRNWHNNPLSLPSGPPNDKKNRRKF